MTEVVKQLSAEGLISRYVGRKLLVFLVGCILLALTKITCDQWMYLAVAFMGVSSLQKVAATISETSAEYYISKYVGRKVMVFLVASILLFVMKDFDSGHWLVIAGTMMGTVATDAITEKIGVKINKIGEGVSS